MGFLKSGNSLLYLLVLVTLLKQILLAALVPIWHTPDEQAHFAQVAFFGEFNKMPDSPLDTNNEIVRSERILGTERNEQGNNKFTFNPDFRIEYTDTVVGKYESEIKNFPQSYRQDLVRQEAANYPPLYYWLSGGIYKVFYNTDLITRIYGVRFLSILLSVGVVIIGYFIAKLLFPSNKIYQFSFATLVSFHPMLSFVGVGVTSDTLMNFLFAAILLLGALIIDHKITKKLIFWTIICLILLLLTKPQFILALPILLVAFVISLGLNYHKKVWIGTAFITALLGFGGLIGLYLADKTILARVEKLFYNQSFFPGDAKVSMNFLTFFKDSLRHTIAEVMPWYWGVYNWLGVTYPRITHRIVNRIVGIALIGFLIKLILIFKKRQKSDYILLFLVSSTAIYFLGITFYNYLFFLNHGFAFGIQGRYYFPTVIGHLAILFVGLITFVPSKFNFFKNNFAKTLGIGMIIFQIHALITIASAYYNFSSFQTFIIQASQYKPDYLKGTMLIGLFVLYSLSLLFFVFHLLILKNQNRN